MLSFNIIHENCVICVKVGVKEFQCILYNRKVPDCTVSVFVLYCPKSISTFLSSKWMNLILIASNYFTKGVMSKICDSPQKARMEKIEFCIVAFEPSKIRTNSALESNYLNLIFLERFHVIIYMSSFLLWHLAQSQTLGITLYIASVDFCHLQSKKDPKKKSFLDKIG